jgi:hypothetical protein
MVTGGLLLAEKYHLELETGVVMTMIDGRLDVSYSIVLGVYFRMGGSH